MAPKKIPVDWRTVKLKDFSNVEFKENANLKSSSSAIVKNARGNFLEFVSPKMRCFGISYMEADGKLCFSVSHAFGENDTEEVKAYRKFLGDLHAHLVTFCDGGKKPDPLVQYPKVKDPNRPGEFLKQGNQPMRDTERSPTVRYKIYPERKNGAETGCLGVRLYDKKEKPLFHYGDKESDEHFRDREIPERTYEAEMAAIEKGCMIRVLCTARLAALSNGGIYYATLAATQIKRITAGDAAAPDAVADFGDDDDDDDEEQGGGGVVAAISGGGKKRPAAAPAMDDDGIEDELDGSPAEDVVVAAPTLKKRKAEEEPPAPEEEEEEEPVVVVVAPPPPAPKKRKLTVAK